MSFARMVLFTLSVAAPFAARGAVGPCPDHALRDELLSRVEMLSQMDVSAEQLIARVEMEIASCARPTIMAYGATASEALPEYLRVARARRKARSDLADLARARRGVLECLAEDHRLDGYRASVAEALASPTGAFDASAATADLPVDDAGLSRCLSGLGAIYQASMVGGFGDEAAMVVTIRDETARALRSREAALARHPLRRVLDQARDAARGVYFRFRN